MGIKADEVGKWKTTRMENEYTPHSVRAQLLFYNRTASRLYVQAWSVCLDPSDTFLSPAIPFRTAQFSKITTKTYRVWRNNNAFRYGIPKFGEVKGYQTNTRLFLGSISECKLGEVFWFEESPNLRHITNMLHIIYLCLYKIAVSACHSLFLLLQALSATLTSVIQIVNGHTDRLCGLVVRVLGYRSGGPGSIPGTTRKKI
jgi:hypothetical protein